MQVTELITRASEITGSDYALANALAVERQSVSNWKHGRKACPVDVRACMASLIGLDPMAELVEAVAEGLSEARRAVFLQALSHQAESPTPRAPRRS